MFVIFVMNNRDLSTILLSTSSQKGLGSTHIQSFIYCVSSLYLVSDLCNALKLKTKSFWTDLKRSGQMFRFRCDSQAENAVLRLFWTEILMSEVVSLLKLWKTLHHKSRSPINKLYDLTWIRTFNFQIRSPLPPTEMDWQS